MSREDHNSLVIEAFAEVCESLNEYAQKLRRVNAFPQVTTGADIRHLVQGWRLRKFVEAQLSASEGFWVGWSIELGGDGNKWVVSSNVSISHTDVFFELDEAEFESVDELLAALKVALNHLTNALDDHDGFREAVAKMKRAD